MDDDELITRLAGGDDTALRELFARHAPMLAARLRAVLPAPDVEDALQETFLAVGKGAGSCRPEEKAGGWLWGIARRQAALLLRRRGPATETLPDLLEAGVGALAGSRFPGDPAQVVGAALAVAAFLLAGTANVADTTSTLQIPAIDNALAAGKPIPYTPVCASAGSFHVCLHPAFRDYLPQVTSALAAVVAELAGLPGTPVRAVEVSQGALPPAVAQGNGDGQVKGGVYEFSMTDAAGLSTDSSMLGDSLQQDIVQAVIIGSSGQTATSTGRNGNRPGSFQPDNGSTAQQAVADGLLKALGSQPFPVVGPPNGPAGQQFQQQNEVTQAAAKFAALPAATRRAWLAANLAALKAGTITVAQLP